MARRRLAVRRVFVALGQVRLAALNLDLDERTDVVIRIVRGPEELVAAGVVGGRVAVGPDLHQLVDTKQLRLLMIS